MKGSKFKASVQKGISTASKGENRTDSWKAAVLCTRAEVRRVEDLCTPSTQATAELDFVEVSSVYNNCGKWCLAWSPTVKMKCICGRALGLSTFNGNSRRGPTQQRVSALPVRMKEALQLLSASLKRHNIYMCLISTIGPPKAKYARAGSSASALSSQ